MKFQVPQFTEVEDKIFGPLTLKQFIYIIGGAGIIFLLYISLPFFLVIIIGLPVIGFVSALAFFKMNNQPFIKIVESALRYRSGARLYLWKKENKASIVQLKEGKKDGHIGGGVYVPKLTKNKLKDLSWSLDIKKN